MHGKHHSLHQFTVSELSLLVFVKVDDYLKSRIASGRLKLPKHPNQKCSYAELFTIALVGELKDYRFLGHWFMEVKKEHADLFPVLPSLTRFYRIMKNSAAILADLATSLTLAFRQEYEIIDSAPIPICEAPRTSRPRAMTEASIGKRRSGFFLGFKLHAVINPIGQMVRWSLAPANIHDVVAGRALVETDNAAQAVIGDKGYASSRIRTPPKTNAKLPSVWYPCFSKVRKRIETTFSTLVRMKGLRGVQLNSFWSYRARINLKIAGYNLKLLILREMK